MSLRKFLQFALRAGTRAASVPTAEELKVLRQAAMAGDRPALLRARRRFADSRDVLKYAGICHYRRKENAEAALALEQALAADRTDGEATLFLMRVHYATGAFEKCEQAAHALLALSPDHEEGLRTLGRIHNRRRAWADAAAVWRRLEAALPQDAEASLQVARACEHLNDHAEALIHADRALLANPQNGEAARIKIAASIALGHTDLQPVVDAIGAFYRFDPPRALVVVRRLAGSADPRTTASMLERLSTEFSDDAALDLLASTIEGGWRVRLARQRDTTDSAPYRQALEILARIARKAVSTSDAQAETAVPPAPHSAPLQLFDDASFSINRAGLSPDDVAAIQVARAHLREDRLKEAESALLTAISQEHPPAEALRITLKIQLIEGRIEDAVATAQPFILHDPQKASRWFAGQTEEWALLVSALAFSRSLSSDRGDVLAAAERLGRYCLGRGFEREMQGDMVGAFVAYHAAASLRPGDADAALSERRVREACHAALDDDAVVVQGLLPSVSAKIFALTIG